MMKMRKDLPSIKDEIVEIDINAYRAFTHLTDIVWSMNMNMEFTYVSPIVRKILGYSQDQLVGKPLDFLLTPESMSVAKRVFAEAKMREDRREVEELPPVIEVEAMHKDGSTIWLELSRVFTRDEAGEPKGMMGVARDITARIQARKALQESEEKYKALAERSVVGIAIAQDNPVRFGYVNETMASMIGYTVEEIQGLRGEETAGLLHPEDVAMFFARFRERLLDLPTSNILQFRAVHKDGSIIWLEVHGTRIMYESNPAVLATFVNITERKLAQIETENARRFTEFLIDLMGHDLNNIHQGLMTSLELMMSDESLPRPITNLVGNSLDQLERAVGLIKNVKTLSDVKSAKMNPVDIDLYDPITRAVGSVKKTFPNRRIQIHSNIGEDEFHVLGCRFLSDAFYNLLHNAVKADPNETVILDIHAVAMGDLVQISFADHGKGITESEKERLLSRLQDRSAERSGIGFTLVQQIVERCNGTVSISDRVAGQPTEGAKVTIVLRRP